jgi:phosphoheptose isomerase
MDASGDFVVAWQSSDGSGYGIYAQRYNAAGVPKGAEFPVNTYTTLRQAAPAVAMDADGNFIVAWQSQLQDGSNYGVYAQRYNSTGAAAGAEFLVNTYTTSAQFAPAVAMDADGDFIVAWHSYTQDGSSHGVYAQRYNATGDPQGGEFLVNTFTENSQSTPSVAMDANGDFVIAWHSLAQDDGTVGVYAQRFDANGQRQGEEFRVNTFTTNNQGFPSAAMDADGDFVIAWQSFAQDGSNYGVYAQRYNAAAVPQGTEFRVNTHVNDRQESPSAAMDGQGNFAVLWQSNLQDGAQRGVYGQAYNAAGIAQGGEFRVNSFTPDSQELPRVAMRGNGDFVAVWQSNLQDGSSIGVYGQRYAVPDSLPPTAQSTALEYDARQAVAVTFSEPLDPATVSATDLSALNLDNSSTPVANSVVLSAGNTIATWIFNTSGSFISDGDYQFTLPAGAVSDVAGNALAASHVVSGAGIFFLAGDANRDRVVNLADFNVLASNFGQPNRMFSQGDFNYDSLVNLADFNILASRFGTSLGASARRDIDKDRRPLSSLE